MGPDGRRGPEHRMASSGSELYPGGGPEDPTLPDHRSDRLTVRFPGPAGETFAHTGVPVDTIGFAGNPNATWPDSQRYGISPVVTSSIDGNCPGPKKCV